MPVHSPLDEGRVNRAAEPVASRLYLKVLVTTLPLLGLEGAFGTCSSPCPCSTTSRRVRPRLVGFFHLMVTLPPAWSMCYRHAPRSATGPSVIGFRLDRLCRRRIRHRSGDRHGPRDQGHDQYQLRCSRQHRDVPPQVHCSGNRRLRPPAAPRAVAPTLREPRLYGPLKEAGPGKFRDPPKSLPPSLACNRSTE